MSALLNAFLLIVIGFVVYCAVYGSVQAESITTENGYDGTRLVLTFPSPVDRFVNDDSGEEDDSSETTEAEAS